MLYNLKCSGLQTCFATRHFVVQYLPYHRGVQLCKWPIGCVQ